MQRVRLDVAYKGTDFHGFARQRNDEVETVAGRLEVALFRYLRTETKLVCAGRTDAGVHALGQVVSFDVDPQTDLDAMVASLDKQVGGGITVSNAQRVDDSFDARFSATARHYRYLISDDPIRNPLERDTVWWVGNSLDIDLMNEGAAALLGEHDFSSFCRRPEDSKTLVRRILSAAWRRDNGLVRFDIAGTAFCHQMVRSLTGELVAIGLGKRPQRVAEVLAAQDRSHAASIAPAHGLCLMKVDY